MKKMMTVLTALAFVLMASAGCSTFKGVGKDVSKLGDKIENKAEKTEQAQKTATPDKAKK